jgi:SulP family sulfate permease
MPATGAIARTATNIKNAPHAGGGITHAVTLLLITLFFGRWVAFVLLATSQASSSSPSTERLATVRREFSAPRRRGSPLATFLLTVLVNLTVAGGRHGAGRLFMSGCRKSRTSAC